MSESADLRKPTDIQNEQLWQFPMHYPIKIIGLSSEEFVAAVHQLLANHFPSIDLETLVTHYSSNKKYTSINASLYLENKQQVNALYADLAAHPLIKTVL